jgi:hypothetical protein
MQSGGSGVARHSARRAHYELPFYQESRCGAAANYDDVRAPSPSLRMLAGHFLHRNLPPLTVPSSACSTEWTTNNDEGLRLMD